MMQTHATAGTLDDGAEKSPEWADLQDLPLDALAATDEAADIVARFTRNGSEGAEPVRVAAFNSFI